MVPAVPGPPSLCVIEALWFCRGDTRFVYQAQWFPRSYDS